MSFKPCNQTPSAEEAFSNVTRWLEYLCSLPQDKQSSAKNGFIGALAVHVPPERWNECMAQIQRDPFESLKAVSHVG